MDGDLTDRLKAEAASGSGSTGSAIAPAVAAARAMPRFLDWLERGTRRGWTTSSARPRRGRTPTVCSKGRGRSSWSASSTADPTRRRRPGESAGRPRVRPGADYHERALAAARSACSTGSEAERPEVRGRAVADTAPLLERDFARLAGLGWIGKNTMLIDRRLGSFTVLGALLVDVELTPDAPHRRPTTAGPAPAASTPARPTPSPAPTSSTPAAASATGRSSTGGRSPTSSPTGSTAGSSAATSARTSARGTARPRRAASPSSSRGRSGPTPT